MSYNPVKNVDFNLLPNYSIANVPILTYALLGITTLTLGYITIKDKESESESGSGSASESENSFVDSVVSPATAIAVPVEKGGKKPKKSKTRSKKHHKP
jgi:hypothetical protein